MSRTFNTDPYKVQERRLNNAKKRGQKRWWVRGRILCYSHPGPVGGAWKGRKLYAKLRNRQFRARVREALHHGREMPIYKKAVRYDVG